MSKPTDRGFALLIVLWSLVLLALIGTRLVAAGRGDTLLTRNLINAASIEAATEGAIQEAIFQMLQPPERHWLTDGAPHVVHIGSSVVTVRLEDEGDKVNLNIASAALLRSLLTLSGAPPATASALAAAIIDWRTSGIEPSPLGAKTPQYVAAGRDYAPPGSDFQSVDELGAVLGMTPALLGRLRPHVTVYSDADPDSTTRDPLVAAALSDAGVATAGDLPGLTVVSVIASASGPDHTAFFERIVVRLSGRLAGHAYDILALDRETPAPSPSGS